MGTIAFAIAMLAATLIPGRRAASVVELPGRRREALGRSGS
jgi:hypothetical protein